MPGNKKVLIIEDEADIQKILSDNLTKAGYEVVSATNGQAGLEAALQNHPDLILLDIIMPVMDGMTALEKIREDEWGKGVPVIILTNLSDGTKAMDAKTSGVYDYLVKADWDLKDVVQKINEKLGN